MVDIYRKVMIDEIISEKKQNYSDKDVSDDDDAEHQEHQAEE